MDFLGLNGADAEGAAISGFQESPGQKFLRMRAERARLRGASATGDLRGGNVLRAINEDAIGIASGQLSERKDRLAGVASGGSNANANRAVIGTGLSRDISNQAIQRGDATASGILGSANSIRNTIRRVGGAFTGTGGFGSSGGGRRGGGGIG